MDSFERFKKVYEDKANAKPKVFCEATGIKSNTLSTHMSRETVGMESLIAVAKAYRDINLEWLFLGEGEPYKTQSCLDKAKAAMKDILGNDDDETSITTASQDDMEEVSAEEGIPYYDLEYACGYDEFSDSAIYPDSYITCKGFERATLFCNASGNSMSPLIDNGDIVALKKIDSPTYLPLGEIYALQTTNGMRTIKRLRKGSSADTYTLEPINSDYDSEEIHKSDIDGRFVYQVVGCLKRF